MENLLHRYKNRSKQIWILNFHKYTSSYLYKDKVIHSQLIEHKREISYLLGEVFSKLMLTLYKPWIENFDDFLDKTMRNPKDSFSRHLRGYILNEEFSEEFMMNILRVKITLKFSPYRRNEF